LLINKDKTLKKAIATAGIISMIVYVMFATIVVGVTGLSTTQIATIGLGQAIGKPVFIIGNLFAAFAMATSFLMAGMGLRDSLRWDFRLPSVAASVLVCVVPFLAFIIGTHTFISAINIVGGVFMSIELICILLIYREAKKRGDIDHTHLHRVGFHASAPILMALMCAFSVGAIYSVLNLL
jgi:amino acid permease